jgi:hypothetical protein
MWQPLADEVNRGLVNLGGKGGAGYGGCGVCHSVAKIT